MKLMCIVFGHDLIYTSHFKWSNKYNKHMYCPYCRRCKELIPGTNWE